jgi:hypothetical protein
MKKEDLLVLVAGLILVATFVLPAPNWDAGKKPAPEPAVPVVTDPVIVQLLAAADDGDRARIEGIYNGLSFVLKREPSMGDHRLATTEQWADLHTHTLDRAVEQKDKYPGLNKAINDVFLAKTGTDDVLPTTPEVLTKLIEAADIVANSARKQKGK